MRKLALQQAIVILLNLAISGLLLFISLKIIGFEIETIHDPYTFIRRVQCDMSVHVCIQVAFQICLQIACFVPAFRSRKLPNVYSESMRIVYVSLWLCLIR